MKSMQTSTFSESNPESAQIYSNDMVEIIISKEQYAEYGYLLDETMNLLESPANSLECENHNE